MRGCISSSEDSNLTLPYEDNNLAERYVKEKYYPLAFIIGFEEKQRKQICIDQNNA